MSKKSNTDSSVGKTITENCYYLTLSDNSISHGNFGILQLENGSLAILLATTSIPLSYPQTKLLPITLYQVPGFDQEKYNNYYLKNL